MFDGTWLERADQILALRRAVFGQERMNIDPGTDETWMCRRNVMITRPMSSAVRRTGDGIPYLAPELQLLMKAKRCEPRDEADFANVVTLTMDDPAGSANTMSNEFQAALMESEAEYRSTFEEAPVGIAHITLNRPERKNPLTFDSYAELRDLFQRGAQLRRRIAEIGAQADPGARHSPTGCAPAFAPPRPLHQRRPSGVEGILTRQGGRRLCRLLLFDLALAHRLPVTRVPPRSVTRVRCCAAALPSARGTAPSTARRPTSSGASSLAQEPSR